MVVLLVLLLGGTAYASAFSAWSWRMPITFIGYDKPGTLTNFPVLVKLGTNLAGFSYSDFASPTNGGDLRFSDVTETNELNCEIETWDTNGTSFVWVQVPAMAGTNTRIHAFWGNGSASMPAYATNGATWSAGFRGVWHMRDSTNVTDATPNGNNGTGYTGIGITNSGVAGNALALNGTSHYVNFGNGLTMGTNNATLSIWLRTSTASFSAGILGKSSYRAQIGRYVLLRESGNMSGMIDLAGSGLATTHPWAYNDNVWHLATVTYDRTGNMTVYMDGVRKSSTSISAYSAVNMGGADPFYAGAYGNNTGTGPNAGWYFPGSLDEGRLMTIAASSNWVWATYMNAASNAFFQDCGPAEAASLDLAVAALPATEVGATNATANGQVQQTGGAENPAVYVCWGYGDGGTNATSAWARVDYVGTNWGPGQSFSWPLTHLVSGTTYVYRCYATNSTGSDWSDTARSFTLLQNFSAWTRKMPITFTGYDKTETLTNFPVLLRLSTNLAGFSYADFQWPASGADLRFTGSNGTDELNYEIESWDPNGESLVWVQVPQLAGTNTRIVAFWDGNASPPPYTTNGTTWLNAFQSVWHLADSLDSSPNAYHGTVSGGASSMATPGMVGNGWNFDGTDDQISFSGLTWMPTRYSVSFWIKPDTRVNWNQNIGNGWGTFLVHTETGGGLYIGTDVSTRFAPAQTGANVYEVGKWCHIDFTFDSGAAAVYKNGVRLCTKTGMTLPAAWTGGFRLTTMLDGIVDELRIASLARSSNWVWAAWTNQVTNSLFAECGLAEPNLGEDLTVQARPASDIGADNAMLNGRLTGDGGDTGTTIALCWGGADAGTGATNDWPNVVSLGDSWQAGARFSNLVSSLLSGSTYIYRAYATNATGFDWSDNVESFTVPVSPTLSIADADRVLHFSARLHGELLGNGYQDPAIRFDYWPTGGGITSQVHLGAQPPGPYSTVVSGLIANSAYSYVMVASNMAATVTSGVATFTTRPYGIDWYVSTNGSHGDATNWATAFTNLQAAVDVAASNDAIRVAGHVFRVGASVIWTNSHVSIVGGHEATSASGPGPNDPELWPTVLTRNAGATTRLLTIRLLTNGALANLVFSNGYLSGSTDGAGLWISNSALSIARCTFVTNVAISGANDVNRGGGLYAKFSNLQITNCQFRNNYLNSGEWAYNGSAYGSGAYVEGGRCEMADCDFRGNNTYGRGLQGGFGGGLYVQGTNRHTITNCRFTRNYASGSTGYGGALYITGAGAGIVDRCLMVSNVALYHGAGVFVAGGEIRNSLVGFNAAGPNANCSGGGVRQQGGVVQSCTIAQNTSTYNSGGLSMTAGGVTNTIVYFNTRLDDLAVANVEKSAGAFDFSCATPAVSGIANLEDDPQFKDRLAGDFTIQSGSACIDAGTNQPWMTGVWDWAGTNARIVNSTVDIGCHEADFSAGPLSCNFIADPVTALNSAQVAFSGYVGGGDTNPTLYAWDLDNNGTPDRTGTNLTAVTNLYGPGIWSVSLTVSNLTGETATALKSGYIRVVPSDLYVSPNGDHTLATNWATAYRDIQTALDMALSNTTIHLAGQSFGISTRLSWSAKHALTIRGGYQAAGPDAPGAWDPAQWPTSIARTSGSTRVMIINQVPTGVLEHVTITGGNVYDHGGGIRISGSLVALQDCTISNNLSRGGPNADMRGGGLYTYGSTVTLRRCSLSQNMVYGDAWSWNGSTRGGALYVLDGAVTLDTCTVSSNTANSSNIQGAWGGGVYFAGGSNWMRSCLVQGNRTIPAARGHHGGGIYMTAGTVLENCTVVANSITETNNSGAGVYVAGGAATNCIAYLNLRNGMAENVGGAITGVWYSCAPELTNAANFNTTNDPLFVAASAGNYRLSDGSPCVNTGMRWPWHDTAADLDGRPRMNGASTDMGAYECPTTPGSVYLVY